MLLTFRSLSLLLLAAILLAGVTFAPHKPFALPHLAPRERAPVVRRWRVAVSVRELALGHARLNWRRSDFCRCGAST